MIRASFTPLWITTSIAETFIEGAAVSVQLETSNYASVSVPFGTRAIECGHFAPAVTHVIIDNIAASFSIIGTQVVIAEITRDVSQVYIISSSPNTISLLCEELPPGLSISNTGLISGTFGAVVPLGTRSYEFVIRAVNNTGKSVDKTFAISGSSISYPNTFDMENMPAALIEPTFGISYIPLGSYQPSQAVSFSVDVVTHDQVPVDLRLDQTFFIPANDANVLAGMPAGVTLIDNEIVGQISVSADEGLHFFRLVLMSSTGNQTLIFGLNVIPYNGIPFRPPVSIQWVTPSDLGRIAEGEACSITVNATVNSFNGALVYSIPKSSLGLPPGLTLTTDGNLVGKLPYGIGSRTFSFTVRAKAGITFSERIFTILVQGKYNVDSVYNIGFELELQQGVDFSAPYSVLVPAQSLFRPEDPNFGFCSPRIYVFSGIAGSTDLSSVCAAEPLTAVANTNNSYFEPIRILLGEHASTSVANSSGTVIYDVVYRKLYEFEPNAGGFTSGDTPVASPVLYPQGSVRGVLYVYPVCVRNMRCKLITTFSCATTDATLSKTFGAAGGESPPLWMAGAYVLAIPIAYVLPGAGAGIANTLNASTQVIRNGQQYTLDRLYCDGGITPFIQF